MSDLPPVSRTEAFRQRLRRLWTRVRVALPFVGGVLATLVGLLLYNQLVPPPKPLTTRQVNELVVQAMASATPPPAFSSLVYQAIRPSFVFIETAGMSQEGKDESGIGSGVVVNDQGAILTSLHVVAGASQIKVVFADGTEATAQIAAQQPENDIAVLMPSQLPEVLVPATLGNPNAVRVGDDAFVVGNPLGLYGSMSSGVISGLNRSFKPPDRDQRMEGLIQIDAAVNPGNSGGPLLNRYGQVIGIVTALVNPTKEKVFIGIGFAVPINVAGGAAGMPPY